MVSRRIGWSTRIARRVPMLGVSLSAFVVAGVSTLARGNGGPVAYTNGAAEGGIFPVANRQVALRAERLRIVIEPDGSHYSALAQYTLSNPGPEVELAYGVPMFWNDSVSEEEEQAPDGPAQAPAAGRVNARAKAAAARIRIELGGRAYTCSPVVWNAASKAWPHPPVVVPGPGSDEIGVQGWCVARVTVPRGEAVPLTLAYRTELRYYDEDGGESVLTAFGPRTLEYALFPAGFWKGTADLSIELELGRFAPYATVSAPPGGQRRGTTQVWTLTGVDLRKLPAVQARIDPRVLAARELAEWNAKPRGDQRIQVAASASSELAAQGRSSYSARSVTDGNPATAWCEGVPGDGVGQWVELRFERTSACNFQGLAVVPGYAKSADAYRANGRVSLVRLGACGGGAGGEHRIEVPDDPAVAAVLLPPPDDDQPQTPGAYCVRLTILGVIPGARYHDTCIAEIAPVFGCP